jgi:hypothetical protein
MWLRAAVGPGESDTSSVKSLPENGTPVGRMAASQKGGSNGSRSVAVASACEGAAGAIVAYAVANTNQAGKSTVPVGAEDNSTRVLARSRRRRGVRATVPRPTRFPFGSKTPSAHCARSARAPVRPPGGRASGSGEFISGASFSQQSSERSGSRVPASCPGRGRLRGPRQLRLFDKPAPGDCTSRPPASS